jgi:hypothetical protein
VRKKYPGYEGGSCSAEDEQYKDRLEQEYGQYLEKPSPRTPRVIEFHPSFAATAKAAPNKSAGTESMTIWVFCDDDHDTRNYVITDVQPIQLTGVPKEGHAWNWSALSGHHVTRGPGLLGQQIRLDCLGGATNLYGDTSLAGAMSQREQMLAGARRSPFHPSIQERAFMPAVSAYELTSRW